MHHLPVFVISFLIRPGDQFRIYFLQRCYFKAEMSVKEFLNISEW